MKKIITLLALVLLMLSGNELFAQRQGKQHKHMNNDSAFAKISTRLNLTAEQQTKLKEIIRKNREELKAVKEANKNATKEEKRKALVAQMKKGDEQIKAVLNDTQKAEYEKIKQERKGLMKKKNEQRKRNKKITKPEPGTEEDIEEGIL